jgi:hypothetical protein
MKFTRVLALLLAVCMMSAVFVACDKGGNEEETETVATESITVTLIIKDADGKTVDTLDVPCNGTLGDAIEMYCAAKGYDGECFDANGLLSTIGDLSGSNWKAYYEDEGSNNAFGSIKDQTLQAGKKVVVSLK